MKLHASRRTLLKVAKAISEAPVGQRLECINDWATMSRWRVVVRAGAILLGLFGLVLPCGHAYVDEVDVTRERIVGLLGKVPFGTDLGGGLRFDEYERTDKQIVFHLHRVTEGGRSLEGSLVLGAPPYGDRHTRSFAVTLVPVTPRPRRFPPALVSQDEQAFAALVAGYRSVAARDDGSYGDLLPGTNAPFVPLSWFGRWRGLLREVGLLAGFSLVMLRMFRRPWRFGVEFRMNHLLPALLQTIIYTYWAAYYPGVRERVPDIMLQIAFSYFVDFVIAIALHGCWFASFAPLPIVLSTNLFVWYNSTLALVVVALAIASRALLRRGGRPIFNPSAFAISVAALLTLVRPDIFPWGTPAPDIELNLGANTL